MGRDPFSEKQDRVTFWPFFASEVGELSTGLEIGSVERKLKNLNHRIQDELQARLGVTALQKSWAWRMEGS